MNASGDSAFSEAASITTAMAPAPPATPTGPTATAVDATRVNVSWTDASTNETGFVLERSTSPAFSGATVRTFGVGTTSAEDTGLTASTTYYYRVKATGTTGDSPWSSTAMVTTPPPPPPPPSGSTYAAAVLADAPRSYWRLGETTGTTAADQRNASPGTYRNGAMLGQPGLLVGDADPAVRLDGIDDDVTVPHAVGLNAGAAFSVEAWFQPASIPAAGGWASLVTKRESYSLQFNGPRLEFTIVQNGARRRLQAPAGAVVAGTTYHVVGTYDGATQRLYLNGSQVASVALRNGVTATAEPLRIGSWDGANEFFAGIVDEVAIYPVALSGSQVAGHHTRGRTA